MDSIYQSNHLQRMGHRFAAARPLSKPASLQDTTYLGTHHACSQLNTSLGTKLHSIPAAKHVQAMHCMQHPQCTLHVPAMSSVLHVTVPSCSNKKMTLILLLLAPFPSQVGTYHRHSKPSRPNSNNGNTMAQLTVPTEPVSGVTISHTDDTITITIAATSPSDDGPIDKDTRALWHAAYARLREEHTEELDRFEKQARIAFRPLQRSNSSNVQGRSATPGWHTMAPKTVLDAVHRWLSEREEEGDTKVSEGEWENDVRRALWATKTLLSRNVQESPSAHLAWVAAALCIQVRVCVLCIAFPLSLSF